jgi:hypothetical protein
MVAYLLLAAPVVVALVFWGGLGLGRSRCCGRSRRVCDAPTIPAVLLSCLAQRRDDPTKQQVIDRLVAQAGINVDDGANAPTAWMLANAWLSAVNARATISNEQSAAVIARLANNMWVSDPWLPDGELDWDLLGASRTEASGWQQAWHIPARTPQGEAVFVVVRHGTDDPWRILTLTR